MRGLLLALALASAGCESVPILLWHNVGEPVDPPRWVTDANFGAQLDWILLEGYTPITARELDRIEQGEAPRPVRPIVLTFDDGYENFYTHTFPALDSRGMRATLFLISSRVGEDSAHRFQDERSSYVIWPEVKQMQAAGVDVESHSVTHRNMKELNDQEARAELVDSRRDLEAHLGEPVTVFAYPGGGNAPHTHDLVAAAGYRSAHSVLAGLDGQYARLRASVHQDTSLSDLRRMVGGTWWGESAGVR